MLTSAGSTDLFLAKLDSGGGHVWSKVFGDSGQQSTQGAIATGPSNEVILVGATEGTVNFGAGPHTGVGPDLFVAKFSP